MPKENKIFNRIKETGKAGKLREFLLTVTENFEHQKAPVRSINTLESLSKGNMAIEFKCPECGHCVVVDNDEMLELFDKDWPWKILSKPCRCGHDPVKGNPFSIVNINREACRL